VSGVVVVGAGVVGLTCAVRLAEAGHRVDVLARDLPLETTSAVAAAIWYPYRAHPADRVTAWSAASYAEFRRLADDADTGVRMVAGTELLRQTAPDPWWSTAVPDLHRVAPASGWADAWSFTAPVVEMPVYLRWLLGRLADLDVTVTRMSLGALPPPAAGLVVDCAGLGARRLAGDDTVTPVRGQVMVVDGVDVDRWWLDSSGPTYVVPRSRDVVVGGTDEEGDWSRTVDDDVAADILRRATTMLPALAEARVVRHKVGLRPARPAVRLERVGDVIHCYGHGGAGVTLSWGCAAEVAALADGRR
jgi:D-amino-acid oxidase